MKADVFRIRPNFPPELLDGRPITWLQLAGHLAAERRGTLRAKRLSPDEMEVWIEAVQLDGQHRVFPMRLAAYEALEMVNGEFCVSRPV